MLWRLDAAVSDEIATFGGREAPQRRREQVTHLVKGPRAGRAQERFQLREGELDRIEVGAVGRQKAKLRADRCNRRADLRVFVDREVVEDDDVAGP
jgi:hypothetical protein